ncbi:hypothetical protein EJB05_30458, partial [Eragrostis curvula]
MRNAHGCNLPKLTRFATTRFATKLLTLPKCTRMRSVNSSLVHGLSFRCGEALIRWSTAAILGDELSWISVPTLEVLKD